MEKTEGRGVCLNIDSAKAGRTNVFKRKKKMYLSIEKELDLSIALILLLLSDSGLPTQSILIYVKRNLTNAVLFLKVYKYRPEKDIIDTLMHRHWWLDRQAIMILLCRCC